MFKKYILLFVIFYLKYSMTYDMNNSLNGIMSDKKSRANILSFEPLGDQILLGLDFLMPFLKVPIERKPDINGNEPALININTAAVVSTGLLATSSILISYIFKKYVVLGREGTSSEKRRRSDSELLNQELWTVLNNFKLVYKNSSGLRVDTSLNDIFETIDKTFHENDIDLSSCIQKAICTRIQQSAHRVNEGNSSGVDKIVDGLMGIKWFRRFLRQTYLKDAIASRDISLFSNHQPNNIYCDVKYPQCKWSMPEDNLMDILTTYLKFT